MTESPQSAPMPDVQGTSDNRQVAIDKVGVKDVRYPLVLQTPDGGNQQTVAQVNMYVALPHDKKGTHMSRFLEILNQHHKQLHIREIQEVTHQMLDRLHASEAHLELTFPYFIDKKAPITGQEGLIDAEVVVEAIARSDAPDDLVLTLRVPATSLCPCSKEISQYGAHNQRCVMEASVRFEADQWMWIEDLFSLIERCASTQVFAVLKRPDEKFVTEDAYENPKFVEDIVRDLAMALENEPRIRWYRASSENFESIHNHNAYAILERDKSKQR